MVFSRYLMHLICILCSAARQCNFLHKDNKDMLLHFHFDIQRTCIDTTILNRVSISSFFYFYFLWNDFQLHASPEEHFFIRTVLHLPYIEREKNAFGCMSRRKWLKLPFILFSFEGKGIEICTWKLTPAAGKSEK